MQCIIFITLTSSKDGFFSEFLLLYYLILNKLTSLFMNFVFLIVTKTLNSYHKREDAIEMY